MRAAPNKYCGPPWVAPAWIVRPDPELVTLIREDHVNAHWSAHEISSPLYQTGLRPDEKMRGEVVAPQKHGYLRDNPPPGVLSEVCFAY